MAAVLPTNLGAADCSLEPLRSYAAREHPAPDSQSHSLSPQGVYRNKEKI